MEIQKPVFIVGSGRSGSTVLHRMLTEHPATAWISVLCERYPAHPEWNRLLMRVIDLPIAGTLLKKNLKPSEAYNFWERHCHGFRRPFRDLTADDVTPRTKSKLLAAVKELPVQGRNRLLIKITGWPRLAFLNEVFPDAKFVHILRDGRAVANSFLNVDFWWGWRGPENWRMGPLSPENARIWEHYNRSFVALAALQWNIFMDAMEKAQASVDPSRFLMVKYEHLCEEPGVVLRQIIKFCELPWTKEMDRVVNGYPVSSRNPKWQDDLTPEQGQILENVMYSYLQKYGYVEAPGVISASSRTLGDQPMSVQKLVAGSAR